MSHMKDRALKVPAPIAICFLDSGENASFPIAQVCRALGLGLPLTLLLPGKTGCFPLALLWIFISHPPRIYTHCPSLNSCPPHHDLL